MATTRHPRRGGSLCTIQMENGRQPAPAMAMLRAMHCGWCSGTGKCWYGTRRKKCGSGSRGKANVRLREKLSFVIPKARSAEESAFSQFVGSGGFRVTVERRRSKSPKMRESAITPESRESRQIERQQVPLRCALSE